MVNTLVQDVRYAFRAFRTRPALTGVALVTLALGIGANTAIFSVFHAVLIAEPPYGGADRIAVLYENTREFPEFRGVANPFNFTTWEREASDVFASLAAARSTRVTLTGAGDPVTLSGWMVTGGFFDVMGVAPALGRPLTGADSDTGQPVAVITHELWASRFEADPDVVGRVMTVDDEALTIVGVMPPSFRYPASAAYWRPYRLSPAERQNLSSYYLVAVGRLRDGVTVEDAQARMTTISERLEATFPRQRSGRGVFVSSLHASMSERVAGSLRLLQGAVGLVLLIACANVANLLLASASSRRREFAIRGAIGAGRWRIVRQVLTESVLLAMAGAALGSLLAVWGVRGLLAMAPPATLPAGVVDGLNGTALVFAALVAGGTGLLFGLAPAVTSGAPRLADTLTRTATGAGGHGPRSRRIRSTLVGAEVALALMLLIGAGLLARSFLTVMAQDAGFQADGLLTARIDLPATRYPSDDSRARFWTDLYARLDASAGVGDAGGSTALPFSFWEWQTGFSLEDDPEVRRGSSVRTVSAGYFEALQVPVVAGRALSDADERGAEPVVMVNERFRAEFFAGDDPVGRRLKLEDGEWVTIVGVVGDVRHLGLDHEPLAELYRPLAQSPASLQMLAVRTVGAPSGFAPTLRGIVGDLDPLLAVDDVTPMDALVGRTTAQRRFYLFLLSLFAGLAAVLAAVGTYGVMSYVVALRRREVGIRLALGARPGQVSRMVVRQGLGPVVVGLAAGLVGAIFARGVLEAQLFGVAPADPMTLALAAVGLFVVATLTCWAPAVRAERVTPVEVLRGD